MKMTFTKNDNKKTRFSLVEPKYIEGTAKILTSGAKKYSVDNWKKCEDVSRYKDALMRHIMAYMGGEIYDPETGESHLYHASCNLMFLDWFDRVGKGVIGCEIDTSKVDSITVTYVTTPLK